MPAESGECWVSLPVHEEVLKTCVFSSITVSFSMSSGDCLLWALTDLPVPRFRCGQWSWLGEWGASRDSCGPLEVSSASSFLFFPWSLHRRYQSRLKVWKGVVGVVKNNSSLDLETQSSRS